MQCGKNKSWLMMLGCLLPFIAILALPFFGIESVYITWLTFLACPLTMAFMMFMNKNDNEKCH